ncbi:MAG: flagellar hook-associated protein FlgK [Roseivivax sp.]|nr:flagellar hook-associated protein FlgK [Roseivivax sp.]
MGLSGALNNAASGLAINARSANLVSSNISNALTEGYGRRELQVVADTVATYGGVRSIGVLRLSNPVLIGERRLSEARAGGQEQIATARQSLETLIGSPLDGDSLTGRVTNFEASLVTASADPSSPQRLKGVAQAAQALTGKLNAASDGVQAMRVAAEQQIATLVGQLNDGLARVGEINTKITALLSQRLDTSALKDQRQLEIDTLSGIVPLRVKENDRGQVQLFSTGGAILLDTTPPVFGFAASNLIAPHMTLGNALLSGLTMDGRTIDPGPSGPLAGGALAAQFQIRDSETVAVQSVLDGIARDLVQRFGPGGPDTTLLAGDPGLFTDAGLAFLPADEIGLSGRIALNSIVDPAGPDTWKIRDGLNAAIPGFSGDSMLINGLQSALTARVTASSASLGSAASSFASHASFAASLVADNRVDAEKELSFAQAHATALKTQELAGGVDTDAELQHLMQIEQAYAANAQVIRVVDELLQLLLR